MQELPRRCGSIGGEISLIAPMSGSKNTGRLPVFDPLKLTRESTICLPSTATELVLELLDSPCGVDEAFFTRIDGMGIHCDVANDFHILHSIDRLRLAGFNRRHGEKFLPRRYVYKRSGVVIRMNALLHGPKNGLLALTGFESRVGFANHVETPPTTYHLAVRMTRLRGLQ